MQPMCEHACVCGTSMTGTHISLAPRSSSQHVYTYSCIQHVQPLGAPSPLAQCTKWIYERPGPPKSNSRSYMSFGWSPGSRDHPSSKSNRSRNTSPAHKCRTKSNQIPHTVTAESCYQLSHHPQTCEKARHTDPKSHTGHKSHKTATEGC